VLVEPGAQRLEALADGSAGLLERCGALVGGGLRGGEGARALPRLVDALAQRTGALVERAPELVHARADLGAGAGGLLDARGLVLERAEAALAGLAALRGVGRGVAGLVEPAGERLAGGGELVEAAARVGAALVDLLDAAGDLLAEAVELLEPDAGVVRLARQLLDLAAQVLLGGLQLVDLVALDREFRGDARRALLLLGERRADLGELR
jgi:hypothetical protein